MEEINVDIDHSTNVYGNIKATREEKTAKKLIQNIKDNLLLLRCFSHKGKLEDG